MPVPVAQKNAAKQKQKPIPAPNGSKSHPKTKLAGRGRVRREGDEEIVRAARSDTDPDEQDDLDDSSPGSSLVSLPEKSSGQHRRSSHAPDGSGVDHESSFPSTPIPDDVTSGGKGLLADLQQAHKAWSDMMAEQDVENEEISVVDFDDFGVETHSSSDHVAPSAAPRRGAPAPKRPIGMTARQAYLKRLENDPSYTPRVGEFWGHDERLMDKDLRSLSGWWRGKWNNRGRGRGGFAMSARGGRPGSSHHVTQEEERDPTEDNWRHDGYEEQKKAEELRQKRNQERASATRGSPTWRARGRGFARGGALINSGEARASSDGGKSEERGRPAPRMWYRHEHAWTKPAFDVDHPARFKQNDEVSLRVKLPGQQRYVVARISPDAKDVGDPGAMEKVTKPNVNRQIIVKLPKTKAAPTKSQPAETQVLSRVEDAHTVSSPPIPELAIAPSSSRETPSTLQHPLLDTAPHSPKPVQQAAVAWEERATEEPRTQAHAPELLPTPTPAFPNVPNGYPSLSFAGSYPPYQMQPTGPNYPPHPGGSDGMWFDPRMPYGYPTPPPPALYTPPPPAIMHHHHHHHSHSLSTQMQVGPPPPQGYFAPPQSSNDFGPPLMNHPPPSFAYASNGSMIDPQTGSTIFTPAKAKVKVAIRRPGQAESITPEDSVNPSPNGGALNMTFGSSESSNVLARSSTIITAHEYGKPEPTGGVPVQEPAVNPYTAWNDYAQPFNGGPQMYYYPSYPDYSYAQPIPGPPQHPQGFVGYGEGVVDYSQPPIYY